MFDSYISRGEDGRLFCASRGLHAPTRVFLSRRRFEDGISHMLEHAPGEAAVFHVAVRGGSGGTGSVCRRMLNLVGNTLRVCMQGGAVAYLGDAEFAALLQDTDEHAAAAYGHAVATIASGFRVMWDGEMLAAEVRIGGTLAGHSRDGSALLAQAVSAGHVAAAKPGIKLHLLRGDDEEAGPSRCAA